MAASEPPRSAARAPAALDQAAQFWDERVRRPNAECRHWLESPLASSRVNILTTGNRHTYPLAAFAEEFRPYLPVAQALSVGCGVGHLEREAIRANIALHIDGVDISAASLERAREATHDGSGIVERLNYYLADAASWLAASEPGRYQLIFFHGSLHHIDELESVIEACAATLRDSPPGLLYVDEYVGPSRDEWCDADLGAAREFFARLAPEHRRTPELSQPMDPNDPSEMIRSGEIEPILRAHFEILKYRPYYGNIVYPLLSALKGSSFSRQEVEQVVRDAIAREDALIEGGAIRPLFALFVGRPRSPEDARKRADSWREGHPAEETPRPRSELEFDLRRLLAERGAEQRALYAEIERLNDHIREMESTGAWQLHRWLERHVRIPLRRATKRAE